MEKQTRNKGVPKRVDFTVEFWAEVEKELALTSENFTVHVTRLLRENIEKRKANNSENR